jgi:glycine cleavage system protein P-like pyridoxal-binding family
MFHLTFSMWMCGGGPVHADVVVIANSRNFLPVNWEPLSGMMEFDTPNRWMMSVKKDTAYSALRFVIGRASIHLENLSTTTSRWV